MAVTEVGVRLTAKDDGASKTVGNIKQELRAASKELIAMQDDFGAMSAEAIAAAKKVAELKDRIQDAKEVSDLFDPGAKFQAFGNVAKTVAGGFSALQGSMALFGTESKDVEKTLLKVQSAMALSEGLSTIMDGAKDFERLGAIIKTKVVTAFSTLRGAIMATGIGALVVGLGLLIANFDAVKKYISNLIPVFGAFADKVGSIITKFTDWIGVTNSQARALENLQKKTDLQNDAINRTIKVLEAQGGKEAQVYEARRQILQNDIANTKKHADAKGLLYGEDAKKYKDLLTELQVLDIQEQNRKKGIADAEAKAVADKNAAIALENKKAYDAKREAEQKQLEKDLEFRAKRAADIAETDAKIEEEAKKVRDEKLAEEIAFTDGRAAALSKAPLALANATKLATEQISANNQQAAINAQVSSDMQQRAYEQIGQASQQLSNLIGQQTVAGKALALVTIGINTALAISGAIKQATQNPMNLSPFALFADIFARTTAVIAGMVSAKKILSSSNVPSSASGAGMSMGSVSMAAQNAPITPQNTNTRLDAQSLNQIGNAATRAFVVESDVTGNQERVRRLNRAARLG